VTAVAESRERAKRDRLTFADFAEKYLCVKSAAGLVPMRPESDLHRFLAAELDDLHRRRGQHRNILAPRGSAKSSWATFAYPVYCGCHKLESYIVIVSDTAEQACQHLAGVRGELENNEALLADFGELLGKGTSARGDRLALSNGVVMKAIGTGGKIRGRREGASRPSLVIIDDPQNIEHVISALMRERSWNWLTKDVLNAGDPETNYVVLGTALHRDCIVCRLQTTPGWKTKLFKSLPQMPARMDLWREWEAILHDYDLGEDEREAKARAFYEANRAAMDA